MDKYMAILFSAVGIISTLMYLSSGDEHIFTQGLLFLVLGGQAIDRMRRGKP